MSLVAAYGTSDEESDNETNENSNESVVKEINNISVEPDDGSVQNSALFTLLPPPKTKNTGEIIEDEVLTTVTSHDKKKQTVKITIPALSELKDDEEGSKAKKIKLIPKGSSLISMLPKPQNFALKETKAKLTPHVLSKPKNNPVTPVKVTTVTAKPTAIIPRSVVAKVQAAASKHDSDDDDEVVTDFFSLETKKELPEFNTQTEDVPAPSLDPRFSKIPAKYLKKDMPEISAVQKSPEIEEVEIPDDEEEKPYVIPEGPELFAEKGFQRLTGKKKKQEEINIIDINAEDQLPNKDEWLKSLSTEKAYTSNKKMGMPSAQSRRKHQITYLAFQAKERELELKNQWAMNRMTRQQTQAKYGF